jgi:hypothetical protein
MTKIVVIVGFVVAFAAGLMVGMDSHRPGAASPTTKPSYPSWLVAELNLTTKQQEEMHKIWSDTAKKGRHEQDEARRQLRRERDEAIAALVRPEDYGRYDQILKTYNDQMDALDRQARKASSNRSRHQAAAHARAARPNTRNCWRGINGIAHSARVTENLRKTFDDPATPAARRPGLRRNRELQWRVTPRL